MADEPLTHPELLLREASKLMGMLFIGRRDAKAVFTNGQWIAKREKYTLADFRNHLMGDRCLGAYLLDSDSMVRCIAFDIDLKNDADYYLISDLKESDPTYNEVVGQLNLENPRRGNLEAALHDPNHEAHRWACSLIASTAGFVQREVHDALGLTCTTIVTGGGAHVFVPFGELTPAADARAAAHTVMEGIPLFKRRSDNFYANDLDDPSVEIEVFPKQDALTDPDSLGNLIRLPFGMHECGIRTYALNPNLPRTPSWKLPKISSIDALRLQAAVLDLEWEMVDA